MTTLDGKKVSKKNIPIEVYNYDENNIVFCDAKKGSFTGPNETQITYHTFPVLTKNKDGTIGDLLLLFDRVFSFGVQANLDPNSGKLTKHTVALSLYDREGATEEQIQTVKKMEQIIQKAREHVTSIKKLIKKPLIGEAELSNLDKLLYWKTDENGEKIPGQGPIFSPSLFEFKDKFKDGKLVKEGKMCTVFYEVDEDGELTELDEEGNPVEIDPLNYLSTKDKKTFFKIRPLIKIEDVFVGAKICLRCKILEADICPTTLGHKRVLHSVTKSENKIGFKSLTSKVNPLVDDSNENNENSENKEDKILMIEEEETLPVKEEEEKEKPASKIKKKISKPVKAELSDD